MENLFLKRRYKKLREHFFKERRYGKWLRIKTQEKVGIEYDGEWKIKKKDA